MAGGKKIRVTYRGSPGPGRPEPEENPLARSYPAPWGAMSGANLMTALQYLGGRVHPCPFVNVTDRDLATDSEERYSTVIDLSRVKTFSFLVVNGGPHPVAAGTQLSPDGEVWGSFGDLVQEIAPGDLRLLVPQSFLRYARVMYRSVTPGRDSAITVWFQGQGF